MSEKISVEKIQADNVAIGKRATVNSTIGVKVDRYLRADALQQLQQLIGLLSIHADEIERPDDVQADAEAAKAALSKKKLNRARIENLISKVAAGVAGVTILADAVDAVNTTVTRLFT